MPKVIDGLQSRIMQSARERLFAAPPSFSLRAIAKDCGIAVGTIYNYFPDKETLIASVFADDWNQIIAETEASISASEGIEEGVRAIYSGLARFTQSHRTVWNAPIFIKVTGCWWDRLSAFSISSLNSLEGRRIPQGLYLRQSF